ncbi:MAG: branched-chain amino acid transport system II carrier protein [Parachlamydiales bacterium]
MKSRPGIFTTGLAIFSMFFGAGNVFVPLLLGKSVGEGIGIALCGFLLTAIGAPMLGLFSTILCEGDSRAFFLRGGRSLGYLLMGVCLALLGPFAVLPRCLIVSHAAVSPYLGLGLWAYSALALGVLFALMVKQGNLLTILGRGLSPLLLVLLLVLIGVGLATPGEAGAGVEGPFWVGLGSGYDTMDLLASVLFAGAIWSLLGGRKDAGRITLLSGLIGGVLLGVVYVGMGCVAARHGALLEGVATEGLLTHLARCLLGPKLAFVANMAVALACLTTIMGLCVAITSLLRQLFGQAFPYLWTVAGMLVVTGALANLGFGPIARMIHGAATVCYPLMIGLAIWNALRPPVLVGRKGPVG